MMQKCAPDATPAINSLAGTVASGNAQILTKLSQLVALEQAEVQPNVVAITAAKTAAYTVPTGAKALTVLARSANVTVDGVAIPNGATYTVAAPDGTKFTNAFSLAGSSYTVIEVR
jgi:hypothetical protein